MSCRNRPHPSLQPVLSLPAASSAKTNPTATSLQTDKSKAGQSQEPGSTRVFSVSFVTTTPCFTMTSKYTLFSAIIKSLPYYSQIYNGSFGGNNYKLFFFFALFKSKQAKPKKEKNKTKQNKTPTTTTTKTKTFLTTVNTTRAAGLLPSRRGWRPGQLSRGHRQTAGCALVTRVVCFLRGKFFLPTPPLPTAPNTILSPSVPKPLLAAFCLLLATRPLRPLPTSSPSQKAAAVLAEPGDHEADL